MNDTRYEQDKPLEEVLVGNELQTFSNDEFGEIRSIDIDGKPWFVGIDVAEALGYSNTKDVLKAHVDSDDKRIIQRSDFTTFEIPNRGMTIINESGLYSLILSSKLDRAKRFKRWVTSEVLPSIRSKGQYAICTTYENINVKERIQIARLIALTPSNRLDAVREILKPIIGEVRIEAELPSITHQTLVGSKELLFDIMNDLIAENGAVIRQMDDETFAIDPKAIRQALSKHGLPYNTSIKILDEAGAIKKSSEGKRTCPVCMNGQTTRCVVYKVGNE